MSNANSNECISEVDSGAEGPGELFSNDRESWCVRSDTDGESRHIPTSATTNDAVQGKDHDKVIRTVHLPGQSTNIVGTFEVTLLGIGLVIVGDMAFWNTGFGIGFYDYITNTIILGVAFICSSLCLAEMTATFPFAGGIYGFTRVTLGPYFGFIVGCCEMLQNIVYCSAYVIFVGETTTYALGLTSESDLHVYPPLFAVLYLFVITVVNLIGGKCFWWINSLMACIAIFIVLLYIFSSISAAEFGRYPLVDSSISTRQRVFNIFSFFGPTAWFYGGIEMMPLACSDARKPRVSVSRAIVITSVVLFVFAICIIVTSASLSPGPLALQEEILPLVPGLMMTIGLRAEVAIACMIPGITLSAMSFIYIYGKQIRSMSESHLVPTILQHQYSCGSSIHIPYAAILGGSLLCFCLIIVYYFVSIDFVNNLILISNQASYLLYISIPCSYFIFKQRFDTLNINNDEEGMFKNPLGIYGACYSFCMLLIANVTLLTMNEGVEYLIPGFIAYFILISLYYWFWAKKRQGFSPEEQKVLFSAYIINANRRNRHHSHHPYKSKTTDKKRTKTQAERSLSSQNQSTSSDADVVDLDKDKRHSSSSPPKIPSPKQPQPQEGEEHNAKSNGRGFRMRMQGMLHGTVSSNHKVSDRSMTQTESSTHTENSVSIVRSLLSLRQISIYSNRHNHSQNQSQSQSQSHSQKRFKQEQSQAVEEDSNVASVVDGDGSSDPHIATSEQHCHQVAIHELLKDDDLNIEGRLSLKHSDVRDFSMEYSSPGVFALPCQATSIDEQDDNFISKHKHGEGKIAFMDGTIATALSVSITTSMAAIVSDEVTREDQETRSEKISPNNTKAMSRRSTTRSSHINIQNLLGGGEAVSSANYSNQSQRSLSFDRIGSSNVLSPSQDAKNAATENTQKQETPERLFERSRSSGLRSSGESSASEGPPIMDISQIVDSKMQSVTSLTSSELDEVPTSINKVKPAPPSPSNYRRSRSNSDVVCCEE